MIHKVVLIKQLHLHSCSELPPPPTLLVSLLKLRNVPKPVRPLGVDSPAEGGRGPWGLRGVKLDRADHRPQVSTSSLRLRQREERDGPLCCEQRRG